jgi:hypothetical protein
MITSSEPATWNNPGITTTTGTATFIQPAGVTYGYGWPPLMPPAVPEGWRCGACQLVMAPWVPYHQCGSDGTVVNTSSTSTLPPGILCKAEAGPESAAG